MLVSFFFYKQKTAYGMLISDWSSDVCSSDLRAQAREVPPVVGEPGLAGQTRHRAHRVEEVREHEGEHEHRRCESADAAEGAAEVALPDQAQVGQATPLRRSEEHTSTLHSLIRLSSAAVYLNKTIHSSAEKSNAH